MTERLHSEQFIINKVFDPSNNTLRVETETAIVLSGVTLNVAGQVNQGSRGPEPWPVSGTVVVGNTVTTNATIIGSPIVIQGNSTGAPWIVSGLSVLENFSIKNSDRARVSNQNTTITNSATETTIVTAGAAGVFNDIISLVITNRNLDSGVTVTIRDATAGTTKMSPFLAPTGGAVFTPTIPVLQTTAANNWTAQLSHSSSIVDIFAHSVKNV